MTTNVGGRRAPHSAAHRRLQRSGRCTLGCWLLRSCCKCVRGSRRSWPPAAACSAAGRNPNTRHKQHSPVLAVGHFASHSLYGGVDRCWDEDYVSREPSAPARGLLAAALSRRSADDSTRSLRSATQLWRAWTWCDVRHSEAGTVVEWRRGPMCVSDVGINKMTHIQIRLAHPLVLYCVYARE